MCELTVILTTGLSGSSNMMATQPFWFWIFTFVRKAVPKVLLIVTNVFS